MDERPRSGVLTPSILLPCPPSPPPSDSDPHNEPGRHRIDFGRVEERQRKGKRTHRGEREKRDETFS